MGNRLLIIILIIGILGVSGTWILVHRGIDHMLEEQAYSESLGWAEFVKSGLRDINHILRGAPPTFEDLKTLGTAKNIGNVTWFKIYDQDSTVVWSANFREVGEENTSDVFKTKIIQGINHVALNHLNDDKVIAIAYLPIMEGKRFLGAIELTLDLTRYAQDGHRVAVNIVLGIASLFLVLMVVSTFFVRSEISKQRKLRIEAEQAAKARNDFIALVSHELRTPLNGILGALGLMKETNLSAEQTNLTCTAFHSTEHLLDIINDILDFTQVSAHRVTLHPKNIEMEKLANEIDVIFKADADQKGLKLEVIKGFSGSGAGTADLKRLRQILFNLISNAIKFTDQGHIKVHFQIKNDTQTRSLTCEVSDTGIGLSQADQDIVFKRFRQAEETMSRQYSGVGLGLSVCKELAELMGGTLSVSSKINKGSHFTFSIPFPAAEHADEASQAELPPVPLIQAELNILLVEDNQINQKVLGTVLTGSGHKVSIAENGLEAITHSKEDNFDLILMDIQMPHMDGVEATRHIRKTTGKNQHTPIIALSANILEEQRESYIDAGMQACLSKPIKPQDLRQAVSECHQKFSRKD